ncbi:hypothetical protein [Mycoplasma phocimorsus]|uniref:hypothetical protein n=1 Tax=Mycoplasma phocimorsus TaxID=3045839 RepID=UPI0024BF4453|nr:hypothetical protein [Mycoplasma phocimorsus]MDJ1646919.1 hypothetical protein [Mycoplasma phocimorsus]MDJ1649102.1 hypothetical protein [Mycoplasma phocimorsus]
MPSQGKEHILEKPKQWEKEVSLKTQLKSQATGNSSLLTFPWKTVLYVSLGLAGTGLIGFGLYEAGKRLFGKPKGWYVKGKDGAAPFTIDYKGDKTSDFWSNPGDTVKRWLQTSNGKNQLYLPYPDKYNEKTNPDPKQSKNSK